MNGGVAPVTGSRAVRTIEKVGWRQEGSGREKGQVSPLLFSPIPHSSPACFFDRYPAN